LDKPSLVAHVAYIDGQPRRQDKYHQRQGYDQDGLAGFGIRSHAATLPLNIEATGVLRRFHCVITVQALLDIVTGFTGKRGNTNENLYVTVTFTRQPGASPIDGQVLLPP
jgi:hypothetical protein